MPALGLFSVLLLYGNAVGWAAGCFVFWPFGQAPCAAVRGSVSMSKLAGLLVVAGRVIYTAAHRSWYICRDGRRAEYFHRNFL